MQLLTSKRSGGGESGQVVTYFVLTLVITFGFIALATDIGFFFHARRIAQNAADPGALAGAASLPGCDAVNGSYDGARAAAEDYALANLESKGFSSGDTIDSLEVRPGSFDVDGTGFDTVYVRLTRQQNFLFARFLGLTDGPVPAEAEAACLPPSGGGLCPFYIRGPGSGPEDDYGIEVNRVYRFKLEAQAQEEGNRGYLGLYGPGAAQIRRGVEGGCVDPDGELDVWQEGDDVITEVQPGTIASLWKSMDKLYAYEGTSPYPSTATCNIAFDGSVFTSGKGKPDVDFYVTAAPLEDVSASALAPCGIDPRITDNVAGRFWPIAIIDEPCGGGRSCPVVLNAIAWMYVVCWGPSCDASNPGQADLYGMFMYDAPVDVANLTGVSNNPLAPKRPLLVR